MHGEALVFYSPTDDPSAWRDALKNELRWNDRAAR